MFWFFDVTLINRNTSRYFAWATYKLKIVKEDFCGVLFYQFLPLFEQKLSRLIPKIVIYMISDTCGYLHTIGTRVQALFTA